MSLRSGYLKRREALIDSNDIFKYDNDVLK